MARKPIKKNLEQTPDGTLAVIEQGEKFTALIRKLRDVKLPERHGACWDLFLPEDVTLKPGQITKIPLGIAVKLPDSWHAKLFLRSSTPSKYGIVMPNHVGIIDNGYSGNKDEWILCVYRPSDWKEVPVAIPAGVRIAQFSIEKDAPEFEFQEVENLPDPSRGGFGSTGN